MRTDALSFMAGDDKVLKNILIYGHALTPGREEYAPMGPFAEDTVCFLSSWSDHIRALPGEEKDGSIAGFGFWCRRASLLQLKGGYTDVTSASSGGCFKGRGVCLQFVPSNIPALFAYSLAAALLAGNCVVSRLPSRCLWQMQVLIDTLKRTLDEFPLFRSRIVLIKYVHDKKITDWLSDHCDIRVVWGGDASVRNIQHSMIRSTAADITFPHRSSMAVYDAAYVLELEDLTELVRAFYNDTYLNDQNACSSPGIIYWMGSSEDAEKAQNRFWSRVSEFIKGRYVIQPDLAVKKYEQALYMAGQGLACSISSAEGAGTAVTRVLADNLSKDLWDCTMPGGFFIESCGLSLSSIADLLSPVCQTISCAGGKGFKDEVEHFVSEYGTFNVTDAGHTLDFSLYWDRHDLIREMCRKMPEEYKVEHNGCDIYARKQGQGPYLVLIHGVACDSDFFNDAAMLLEDTYTVITYDRRGYSRSLYTDGTAKREMSSDTAAEQASDMIAVLDRIAKEGSRAIVCGCSAGGVIALEAARAYPDRVEKLYIYEAAYTASAEDILKMDEWRIQLKQAAERKSFAKAMLLFIQAIGDADTRAREKTPEQIEQNMLNLEQFLYTEMDSLLDYSKKHQDIHLKMPCLIGAGTPGAGSMFGAMMETAAKSLKASLSGLSGGHNVAEERPEVFAGWIRSDK